MKNKNILIVLVSVVTLGVIGAGQYFINKKADIQIPVSSPQAVITIEQSKSGSKTPPAVLTGDISVTLDFGKGTPIQGMVYAQNAFAALKEIAKSKSLGISVKEYKYGSLVEKIGEAAGTSENFWAYYVNGKLGNVASDKFIIHPQDIIVWKYEKVNK